MSDAMPPTAAASATPQASRIKTILLSSHPARERLIRTASIAAVPFAVSMLLVLFAVSQGLSDARNGWLLCAGMSATILGFYAAFRSGWSQRFKDPSFALAGILLGMAWSAVGYTVVGKIHLTQLLILNLTMAMGVFRLSAKQIRVACLFGVITMGAAILTMTTLSPIAYPPRVELFYLALLLLCLPAITDLGMQRVKLKLKLNRQKTELKGVLAQLKEVAIRDQLTGLHNRAHMMELMGHAVERQQRTGETFSLVMFDLDHFKRINDTHGHGVGDEVLCSFARISESVLRKSDVLARWGGEEFVALCPHSDQPRASVGVDRLLGQWSSAEVSKQVPELRSSFSAGVTTYQPNETIDTALNRADQALYAAKAKGRRCIVVQ